MRIERVSINELRYIRNDGSVFVTVFGCPDNLDRCEREFNEMRTEMQSVSNGLVTNSNITINYPSVPPVPMQQSSHPSVPPPMDTPVWNFGNDEGQGEVLRSQRVQNHYPAVNASTYSPSMVIPPPPLAVPEWNF